ncbi:MAG TPA: ferredoxin reductase [Candidatus Binatia bacterium]|nr:ferredoxin reductase [Candidatus Binatia bacterium]
MGSDVLATGGPAPRIGRLGRLADGFAWPLSTSHYLELLNPLWARHAAKARVEAVRDETRDARTLTLRPGRSWRPHRAGQHVRIGVPVDGAREVRTYSISSEPERWQRDGCIEITVKAVAGGRVSPRLVRDTEPGSFVDLGAPEGDFVLPDRPAPLLFVTAGSGITPIRAMLRSLAARGALSDVAHLHYAPHRRDVIFAREIGWLAEEHAGYRLHVVHTREPGAARAVAPHFAPAALTEVCANWREREVYACGPASLLAAVEAVWGARDALGRLHVERFHAVRATPPADAAGGRVVFARSGIAIEADGSTPLLQVAEKAGLRPAHGCRMGICHSCTATLEAGCVRDVRNNRIVADRGAAVQVCVAAAAGDVEIDL